MVERLTGALTSPVVVVANYRPQFEPPFAGLREIQLGALSPRPMCSNAELPTRRGRSA